MRCLKPAARLLCCCLVFSSVAGAETLSAGINSIKSAVIRGDSKTVFTRLATTAIIDNEVNYAFNIMAKDAAKKTGVTEQEFLASLPTRLLMKTARATLASYFNNEVARLLRAPAGLRRAAVNSFRINQTKEKNGRATLSASYAVPGAAENVAIGLAQNQRGDWLIVSLNSKNLRRAISGYL